MGTLSHARLEQVLRLDERATKFVIGSDANGVFGTSALPADRYLGYVSLTRSGRSQGANANVDVINPPISKISLTLPNTDVGR